MIDRLIAVAGTGSRGPSTRRRTLSNAPGQTLTHRAARLRAHGRSDRWFETPVRSDILPAMRYRVTLFQSDEGWAVSCPDLPGCHSQGATREEALENVREAIRLRLEVEDEETGLKRLEQAEVTL